MGWKSTMLYIDRDVIQGEKLPFDCTHLLYKHKKNYTLTCTIQTNYIAYNHLTKFNMDFSLKNSLQRFWIEQALGQSPAENPAGSFIEAL